MSSSSLPRKSDSPTEGVQRARVYGGSGDRGESLGSRVVELLTESNAAVQVSALPDREGFLIRAWGPNRLHEFGGDNGNLLSVVLNVRDGKLVVGSLTVYEERP